MNVALWKAQGVNNLTDARYFNTLNDAWISFDFDALSPQAVTLEKAKEIIGWLHEPQLVAAFGEHQDAAEIQFVLESTGIQHIEISLDHPLAFDKEFCSIAFISVFDDEIDDAVAHPHHPFAWVIDVALASHTDGQFIKKIIQLMQHSKVVFFTATNAPEITDWLKAIPGIGIQLDTEGEEKTGFSSVDVYEEVIEKVLSA